MRKALPAALALALLVSAASTPAGAAETTGNTTLVLAAGKARTLAKRGIAIGGVRGAATEGRETRLQVSGGTVGAGSAELFHEGALRIAAGKGRARRVVRLTGLRTHLGQSSSLSAVFKGKRRVVFDFAAKPGTLSLDGLRGIASLRGARLVWRRATARAIGVRLGAKIPQGALGTVRASAAATALEVPKSVAIAEEPPLLARPSSAVDVTGATVTWHVRHSWVLYVSSGLAPAAVDGAVPGPSIVETEHPCLDTGLKGGIGDPDPRVYSFTFPFASGWYDPPSGTTALYTSGGVHYRYPSRGIDLATHNPEIELNGASSRAIVRLRGSEGTAYPDSRTAMLNLSLTESPAEGPTGTFTYSAPIRGSLDPNGQSIFAGFYPPPGNGFGCFDVSFSTG